MAFNGKKYDTEQKNDELCYTVKNEVFKRSICFLLMGAMSGYALDSKAAVQQDKGKKEQSKDSGKTVKEVPKSRKQDKPEPVKKK